MIAIEVYLVYGLVVVFFLLMAAFVFFVLLNHPYTEPDSRQGVERKAGRSRVVINTDEKVAYGVIAVMFTCLCVITFLNERRRTMEFRMP